MLVGGLAACATVDADPEWMLRPSRLVPVSAFEDAVRELEGVDPPRADAPVEKGDRILYAVELTEGASKQRWMVYVDVRDPEFEPHLRRDGSTRYRLLLRVRVCDAAGVEIGQDDVVVDRDDLLTGLVRACRGERAEPQPVPEWMKLGVVEGRPLWTPAADSVQNNAILALRNLLRVILGSEVLYDVLWDVVDKPSLVSVLAEGGAKVSMTRDFERARAIAPVALAGREYLAYELPVELRINGAPALRCALVVTEPESPMHLSAGILGIDGHRPSDPDVRVALRVLAARRAADPVDQPRAR